MAPAQHAEPAIAALSAVAGCDPPPHQRTEPRAPRPPGLSHRLLPCEGHGAAEMTCVAVTLSQLYGYNPMRCLARMA